MGRYKNCALANLGAALLLMGQFGSCAAQQKKVVSKPAPTYKYATAGTRLEGSLIERKVYGPPGYGETPAKDERDTILILKLTHPITVEPPAHGREKDSANLDPEKNINEVQLFVSRSSLPEAHHLVGRAVVVIGTLNEAIAPSQYTEVWLDTENLNPK